MAKKYRIHLSVEERQELEAFIAAGKAAVGKRHRAQILLCADENHEHGAMKDRGIARAVGVSVPSVERTRCAPAEHGLQVAVHGWPPPEGASRWTLKLLGDHLVRLNLVASISGQTVGRALKKRVKALAHRAVVSAAGAKRGIRLRDGGRAGSLRPATR